MQLNDVRYFLMVAHTRSLTAAARRLDTTPMTVSRRLMALEADLGVRLLHRTTRAVSLTAEGEEFLPYARALEETERGARGLFASESVGAVGQLRVTASAGFGRRTVLPLIPALMAENPDLTVELNLSDEITDIVGRGFDVAIRIAPLRDSRLVARKLDDNPRHLCASPQYLALHGAPRRLADLSHHHCLRLTNVAQWTFETAGQPTRLTVGGPFSSSSVEGVREMCKAGLGLTQLTEWDIKEELASGELVSLTLKDAEAAMLAVWAVFPTHQHLPARVNVFLQKLQAAMHQGLSADQDRFAARDAGKGVVKG